MHTLTRNLVNFSFTFHLAIVAKVIYIFRRFLRSPVIRAILVAFILWNIFETWHIRSRLSRPRHHARFDKRPRVFIASLHWNDADLLKEHWNKALLDVVNSLGPANVFVSVYESGSWDSTKDYLRELDQELSRAGVDRSILLDPTSHQDELSALPPDKDQDGWVMTPQGTRNLRRVPFLAKLRNKSLQPLHDLFARGIVFDTVLFLNDIVFTAEDVLELLQTNGGEYAAACSLDFSTPTHFYDTFVLRDSNGHEIVGLTWPYFRSSSSRKAMKLGGPVPVTSCWNGMVAMPAIAFTSYNKTAESSLSFRGIDDSLAAYHLEGSECCLIHADNPLKTSHGIYVNPNVRVAYKAQNYVAVNPQGCWLSVYDIITGLWENRLKRWLTAPLFAFRQLRVKGKVEEWQKQGPNREEEGWFCVVDDMQVIVSNGWTHM